MDKKRTKKERQELAERYYIDEYEETEVKSHVFDDCDNIELGDVVKIINNVTKRHDIKNLYVSFDYDHIIFLNRRQKTNEELDSEINKQIEYYSDSKGNSIKEWLRGQNLSREEALGYFEAVYGTD